MNNFEVKEHECSLSSYQISEWASIKLSEGNECHSYDYGFFFDNGTDRFERFIKAVHCVIKRHKVLCSIYESREGKVLISENICSEIPTSIVDLTSISQDKEFSELQQLSKKFCASRFDLDLEIPVRLMQARLLHNAYYVVIRVHKLVLDKAAVKVFFREVMEVCKEYNETYEYAGLLPCSFVESESNFLQSELFKVKLNNTVRALQGIPLLHNLPTDGSRSYLRLHY